MQSSESDGAEAASLARQAEELAGKLKPGSWDSIQALALISIAKSLASIAAAAEVSR